MAKVAVVGSLVVDMAMRTPRLPERGDNLRASHFRMGAGGKGGNAAAALIRLGYEALTIGCVGDDALGRFELASLAAVGVDTSGVTVVEGTRTAVAVILVEEEGQNAVLVAGWTNELLTGELVTAALEPHWKQLDGILVNFECAPEAVQTAVRLGREHQVPVIIDPAPARSYDATIWAGADVLTPNRAEAAALVGFELTDENDVRRAAHRLRAAGPAVIVFKLGANGAFLLTNDDQIAVAAHQVETVDTTGAGDAFTASLMAGILQGKSWVDTVCFANAAGALTTTRFGTLDAMPSQREIEDLLAQTGLSVHDR